MEGPGRRTNKRKTTDEGATTASSSLRKTPKRKAKEMITDNDGENKSKSQRKLAPKSKIKKTADDSGGGKASKSPRKLAAKANTKARNNASSRNTSKQAGKSTQRSNARKSSGVSKVRKRGRGGGGERPGTTNGVHKISMPAIYPFENRTFKQRFDELYDKVIVDCKPFQVGSGFCCYIEENVKNGDWQAVWCSHQLGCDILVEVVQVGFPDTEVALVEPFCCEPNLLGRPGSDGCQLKTKEEVVKLMSDKKSKVPLLELFPVSGALNKTAIRALELCRFFYAYIWRDSDERDCGDYDFGMYHLEERMKIYYDVQKKKVSESIAQIYTDTMSEYQKKYWHFKIRRSEVFGEDDDDEEEEEREQPEDEELNKLWKDVCRLEDLLKKLEDPVMRNHCQMRANGAVVTHLVSSNPTLGLIESAGIDKNLTVELHNTPASALESCYNGDTIVIFPGTYSGKGFTKITKDIDIKGAGKSPTDVVIVCEEKSRKCLNCSAFHLEIENITFEGKLPSSATCQAALMVSCGTTILTNCIFRSFSAGVKVSNQGKLGLEKCQIYDIHASGIAVPVSGVLDVIDSHIHHCGGTSRKHQNRKKTDYTSKPSALSNAGICVFGREWKRSPTETHVYLNGNKIEDVGGPGVWIEVCTTDLKKKSKPKYFKKLDDGFDELMFAGIDWYTSGEHTFKNNKGSPLCITHKKVPEILGAHYCREEW